MTLVEQADKIRDLSDRIVDKGWYDIVIDTMQRDVTRLAGELERKRTALAVLRRERAARFPPEKNFRSATEGT